MKRKIGKNGFMLMEVMVALIVLGVIMGCTAAALSAFGKFNKYQLVRQKCIAAAGGLLDCIAATGKPISDEDFQKLWPRAEFKITQTPGKDRWQGLELTNVKVTAKSANRDVSVELERYFLPGGEKQK
jgi:prepilin-type N-terminal cleavage/methylation domain-containing protein